MQHEIPEDFTFKYPWSDATTQGAFCICVSCGEKAQASEKISEYPFRYVPRHWRIEARTRGARCPKCAKRGKFQPDFYSKYEVHISHDGELPHLHVRPRERMWMETGEDPLADVKMDDEGELNVTQPEAVKETTMEDEKMAEDSAKDIKTRAKDHFSDMGGALAMGLKLAAVNEGGEVLIDIAKEIARDSPMMEALLESPEGREVAKMLVAMTVSGMCHYTDMVPKREIVSQLMTMQMTASGFQLAAPRMKQMRGHFERLVGVSEKLAGIGERAGVQARVGAEEAEVHEAEVESIDNAKQRKQA